jgi:transposase
MRRKKNAFPIIHPYAAGIDISSKEHYVAVNPSVCEEPVRSFGAFTDELEAMVIWLRSCRVDTVAMEATGIYWVSLFQLLEEAGFDVVLVNARHVKNVSGKKTDMSDAEWIRQLHSCGLLSASFQPDTFTRALRSYMRHRKNLLEMSATHVRMMHKALEQMNIKLQHVIADITGKSGQSIIKAILSGHTEAGHLVSLLDPRIKATHAEVQRSLNGMWKAEHLFELQQSFELYHLYQQKIADCDKCIEAQLRKICDKPDASPKPYVKRNKNNLGFDAASLLGQITGTEITTLFGINGSNATELLSETGFDMNKWPTAKHFTSWLNLAPNNKISGGKVLSRKIPKKKNHAGQIFKMAAYAIQRSKNWLAAFYHRIKAKAGPAKAITATARKIAVIFYHMLKDKTEFKPMGLDVYQQTIKEQQLKKLEKQAKRLGLQLVPVQVT